jgi:hypothetical protein
MNWQQIREQYPNRWVVVEALNAVTQGAQRVINELALDGVFDDWESAWREYTSLHNADKWREYYMLHTDRAELNIGVIDSFGRVVAA